MDFSTTPIDKLIAYQWALANALEAVRQNPSDLSQTEETLTELADKVEQAINDEQFEIDKLKEL
jgi:hypothetical protein